MMAVGAFASIAALLMLRVLGAAHAEALERGTLRVGCVLIAAASVISCAIAKGSLDGLAMASLFGCIAGCGMASAAWGLLGMWLGRGVRQIGVGLIVSSAIGCAVFLLFEALFSVGLPSWWSALLPCSMLVVELAFVRGAHRAEAAADASLNSREECEAIGDKPTGPRSSHVLGHRLSPLYAALSGFLVGYVYNVYPKSTRLAGSAAAEGSRGLFGTVPLQVVWFYGTLLLVLSVMAVALAHSRKISRQLIGGSVGLLFAASYFCLPLMKAGMFSFFMSSALVVALPVVACIGLLRAQGRADRSLALCGAFLFGQLSGSLICIVLIEATTPSAALPEIAQDVLIVGPITAALLALSFVAYSIWGSVYLPTSLGAPGKTGSEPLAAETVVRKISSEKMLTTREEEVLSFLLAGRSGVYIADELELSQSTVKTHIRHIYEKLGVTSKQQLIDFAQRYPC